MSPSGCVAELDDSIAVRNILPGDLSLRTAARFRNLEISYGELEVRATRLARRLVHLGVTPTDRIAIALERSLHVPIALRAVLKTGAAYVPLDPGYPAERLAFMLRDSEPRVLLTQRSLERSFTSPVPTVLFLDDEDDRERLDDPLPDESRLDGPAYVIYTSGSTGVPKGVPLGRCALANLIAWQCRDSAADSDWRTLQFTPLSFDVHYQEFFSTWATGGTLVLIDEETRLDPGALLATIEQERIARVFMPLLALEGLAEVACLRRRFPTCLREIVTAGEQLRITPALRQLFSELPECSLRNHYGPSETHVVTAYTLPTDPATWPVLPPIGAPLPGTQLKVVDERGNPALPGTAGELHIGGLPLSEGYFNRPELTAERFVTVDGNRFYRTGDQVRLRADGNYEFLGRLDDQVKIRGNRVELREIEVRLLEHPAVANCAVSLHGCRGVDQRLVGYWTPRPAAQSTAPELRQFLSERLPNYMVPSEFVRLPSLPQSPSGKLDRRALPAPSGARSNWDGKYRAPRNPLERQLATIWAELLGAPSVGVSDNFFEFGGDSVLAVRHMVRVEKELGHVLPMADFYRGPTIEQVAAQIRKLPCDTCDAPVSSLVCVQPRGANPPLFCVPGARFDEPMLFGSPSTFNKLSERLGRDQPVYSFTFSYSTEELSQPMTIERIAATLLRDVRALQPSGPYFLGGWSSGGYVAYEMARQLEAQGQSVGLLALFDVVVPGHPRKRPWREQLGLHFAHLRTLASRQRSAYVVGVLQEWARSVWGTCRALKAKWLRRENRWMRIEGDYFDARKTYSGPTTLFVARKPLEETADSCEVHFEPLLGWDSLVEATISGHRITGDHFSILLDEPGVTEIAERLRTQLAASWSAETSF
jgi:amino acid adenylation domain-containing protein